MKIINFFLLLIILTPVTRAVRNPFEFNDNLLDDNTDITIKVIGHGQLKNGGRFVVLTDNTNTKTVNVGGYFGEYKVISITNFEVTLSLPNGKIKKVEIKKPFNLGQAEGLGGEQHYNVLLV